MKRRAAGLLLCAFALRASAEGPGKELAAVREGGLLPIPVVAAHKKSFHGKEFCVAGKASTIFKKYSRKGNHYYTVWLNEAGAKLKVFAFGFPDFAEGDRLEACGKFTQEKWVSGRVFYDELAAHSVRKAAFAPSAGGGVFLSSAPAKSKPAPK